MNAVDRISFKVVSIVALWTVMTGSFCYGQLIPSKNVTPQPPQVLSAARYPARFFTDQPGVILQATDLGLVVYNLDTKKVITDVVKDVKVQNIAVFANDLNRALISASDGKVMIIDYKDGQITKTPVESLANPKVGIINQFVINKENPKQVICTDSKAIFRSSDGGVTWDLNKQLKVDDPNNPIQLIAQDPYSKDRFIVGTLNSGRYFGGWNSDVLENVPEKAIPHGYEVINRGVSYIPLGENQKYFGLQNMYLEVQDLVISPLDPNVIYLAGLGKSPVQLTIKRDRLTVHYLNERLFSTHTIDVDKKNSLWLLLGSNIGVHYSQDGGVNWIQVN